MNKELVKEMISRGLLTVDTELKCSYTGYGLGGMITKVSGLFTVDKVEYKPQYDIVRIHARRNYDGVKMLFHPNSVLELDGMTEDRLTEAFELGEFA